MTKVYCKKYQEELPALDRPPYPGPRGEEIFNNVSKKAWMEWLQLQTMLINEKQLNLAEKETRDYLNDCLLYTSPSPRDVSLSRMPSSA